MAERKTYEELTFCDDFMFCKVLENDPDLCKALLEVILGHKIRGHVQLRKQASIDHSALSHGVRFDVFAMDKNGIAYDVEMQQAGSPKELPKRSRYQQSMMDLELLRPGEAYGRLRKSYVIFICRFNMYPQEGLHKYSFRNVCRELPKLELEDGAETIFLCTKGKADDAPKELQNLFQYMEEQAAGDALTERIDAAVQQARILGKWRKEYMTLQDYMQKERQEGRKEERANTLREKKRADAAEKRADNERTRADAAEAKIKELEARLKELGG